VELGEAEGFREILIARCRTRLQQTINCLLFNCWASNLIGCRPIISSGQSAYAMQ